MLEKERALGNVQSSLSRATEHASAASSSSTEKETTISLLRTDIRHLQERVESFKKEVCLKFVLNLLKLF